MTWSKLLDVIKAGWWIKQWVGPGEFKWFRLGVIHWEPSKIVLKTCQELVGPISSGGGEEDKYLSKESFATFSFDRTAPIVDKTTDPKYPVYELLTDSGQQVCLVKSGPAGTIKSKAGDSESENGPVIVLPDSHRPLLREKLLKFQQLRGREFGHKAPETIFGIIYRIELIERLLVTGRVHTWDFSREMSREYGSFDREGFEDACYVVGDYCETGGENVKARE